MERSILSEQSEVLSTGNVDIGVYKRYFVAGKGHYLIGPYLLTAVLMEVGGLDLFLTIPCKVFVRAATNVTYLHQILSF